MKICIANINVCWPNIVCRDVLLRCNLLKFLLIVRFEKKIKTVEKGFGLNNYLLKGDKDEKSGKRKIC